ncbi:HTH-type transcriptional regulator ArgR [Rubrivivax sp. A210]|uniref:GlxA family transcriptional regulator n=1 Tax=Rubrivivax sp. A210 TaxID=2772301 RepID=UPI001918D6AD|nr:GlxA family transcriptional regulator [Rubrivivax sp. A210]CAD5375144.1 HTH-type transcriptional regulator ArgR [Rubrivivax sp. A210]
MHALHLLHPLRPARAAPVRVGFVLWPDFGPLSLAGALEALNAANQVLDDALYEPLLLAVDAHAVAGAGGLRVHTLPLRDAPALELAFVVSDHTVGGAATAQPGPQQAQLSSWLIAQAAAGRVLGGIGTGAALLAEAGVLRGHRATVHWPHVTMLAQRHPGVIVSQSLYEIDRQRLSCGGHQASRDLLIAWLAQRHGPRFGQEVAARLGLARVRAADERQRVPLAARLAAQAGGSARLAEAVALMEANLSEPLATEEIAGLVGVSRRQLERLFKQHMGELPSRWYLSLRLQRAQRLLRQTPQSVMQVGLACGFASGSHFSNAYRAFFGHTPRDERSRRALPGAAPQARQAVAPAMRDGAEATAGPRQAPP